MPASADYRSNEFSSIVYRFRNEIPTPYSRCRRSSTKCLVDIRSSRYKTYNDAYKTYDLRVTFREFEKLARLRTKLIKKSEELDNELTRAKEEVARAHL